MGIISSIALTLGVSKLAVSTGIVAAAVIIALPGNGRNRENEVTVKVEMDPWERVKLSEALRK